MLNNRVGWSTFHYFIMRKEYCYLPTLNSLFSQNVHYQKHRYNLKRSKSTFEHTRDIEVSSKEVQEMQRQVLELRRKDSKTVCLDRSESPVQKPRDETEIKVDSKSPQVLQRSWVNLTPYQKRKLSERNQQNMRIYKALQYSNPIVSIRNPKAKALQESLKERISKFSREGNMVVYKFKKSLADIAKRKKQHKTQEISPSMTEQLKKQLQGLNLRRCRTNIGGGTCSDIYVNDLGGGEREKKEISEQSAKMGQIQRVSASRSALCDSSLNERKRRSISERCKTDGDDTSSMMARAKAYLNKRQVLQGSLTANVKEHLKKQNNQQYFMPTSQVLVKNPKRRHIGDMEIVCLPQLKREHLILQSSLMHHD